MLSETLKVFNQADEEELPTDEEVPGEGKGEGEEEEGTEGSEVTEE